VGCDQIGGITLEEGRKSTGVQGVVGFKPPILAIGRGAI